MLFPYDTRSHINGSFKYFRAFWLVVDSTIIFLSFIKSSGAHPRSVADCDTMWQIGVDVLPEYRRKGVAGALTSRLALEIIKRGKVPFYCCAWSNIKSAGNAIKSGFRPAWAELTVKPADFVDKLNGIKI